MGQNKIGRYLILRELGRGGMGHVYLGYDEEIRREVAIKLLLPEHASRPERVERLYQEALAVNIIKHPSIVQINEIGQTPDGATYLVMEYLEGETLSARIRKVQQMTEFVAITIISQIAAGLDAAHNKGIVHRDVKPSNIMLVPDEELPDGERVKLLDFGIAKLADGLNARNKRPTVTGAVMGSPQYMAPEQCLARKDLDGKADVYALGIVMYEIFSGAPPFTSKINYELMNSHLTSPVPPLSVRVPSLSISMAKLIEAMLAKDKNDRPEMKEVLRQVRRTRQDLRGSLSSFSVIAAISPGTEAEQPPAQPRPNADPPAAAPAKADEQPAAIAPVASHAPARTAATAMAPDTVSDLQAQQRLQATSGPGTLSPTPTGPIQVPAKPAEAPSGSAEPSSATPSNPDQPLPASPSQPEPPSAGGNMTLSSSPTNPALIPAASLPSLSPVADQLRLITAEDAVTQPDIPTPELVPTPKPAMTPEPVTIPRRALPKNLSLISQATQPSARRSTDSGSALADAAVALPQIEPNVSGQQAGDLLSRPTQPMMLLMVQAEPLPAHAAPSPDQSVRPPSELASPPKARPRLLLGGLAICAALLATLIVYQTMAVPEEPQPAAGIVDMSTSIDSKADLFYVEPMPQLPSAPPTASGTASPAVNAPVSAPQDPPTLSPSPADAGLRATVATLPSSEHIPSDTFTGNRATAVSPTSCAESKRKIYDQKRRLSEETRQENLEDLYRGFNEYYQLCGDGFINMEMGEVRRRQHLYLSALQRYEQYRIFPGEKEPTELAIYEKLSVKLCDELWSDIRDLLTAKKGQRKLAWSAATATQIADLCKDSSRFLLGKAELLCLTGDELGAENIFLAVAREKNSTIDGFHVYINKIGLSLSKCAHKAFSRQLKNPFEGNSVGTKQSGDSP